MHGQKTGQNTAPRAPARVAGLARLARDAYPGSRAPRAVATACECGRKGCGATSTAPADGDTPAACATRVTIRPASRRPSGSGGPWSAGRDAPGRRGQSATRPDPRQPEAGSPAGPSGPAGHRGQRPVARATGGSRRTTAAPGSATGGQPGSGWRTARRQAAWPGSAADAPPARTGTRLPARARRAAPLYPPGQFAAWNRGPGAAPVAGRCAAAAGRRGAAPTTGRLTRAANGATITPDEVDTGLLAARGQGPGRGRHRDADLA